MPVDPRLRLDRPTLGDSVQPDETLADRFESRIRPERREPVPARDQKELPTLSLRGPRRVPEAGPNAPQLIRLIRFPYALRPEGTRRVEVIPEPVPAERVDAKEVRAAALAERERVRFTSPAGHRVRAFVVRPSAPQPLPPLPEDESSR